MNPEEILLDLIKDIEYIIAEERDYGDEYTSEVLNDLKEKYDFEEIVRTLGDD